jgi:hypothetical protein
MLQGPAEVSRLACIAIEESARARRHQARPGHENAPAATAESVRGRLRQYIDRRPALPLLMRAAHRQGCVAAMTYT